MRMRSEISVTDGLHLLSSIVGKHVWYVRRGADNILRMDFGKPHLHIREPYPSETARSQPATDALERRVVIPRGEWHLFIESGFWSVKTKHYSCDRNDSEHDKVDKTLGQLEGQKLISVKYNTQSNVWGFEFDLEGQLNIALLGDPEDHELMEDTQWTISLPDGSRLAWSLRNKLWHLGPKA